MDQSVTAKAIDYYNGFSKTIKTGALHDCEHEHDFSEEFVLSKYHKSTILYNRVQSHYGVVANSGGQYILNRCLVGGRKDGLNIRRKREINF